MNTNQKKSALIAFVGVVLFFCYKTFSGLTQLNEYSGWKFYALLMGTILFAGLAIAGVYIYPKVNERFTKEEAE